MPGLGNLERVELASRNGPAREIVYLYDTHDGSLFPKLMIRFDLFGGSDRDLALLDRLAFGERRTAMCADMPDALRPGRDRENPDAFWVSAERPSGPLTICWSDLALDVRAGEAVIPFWQDLGLFGVAAGNFRVTIGGSFAAPFEPNWQRVDGSLAGHPEFRVVNDLSSPAAIPPALQMHDGREPRRVRLVRGAENPRQHPYGGVGFAFSGPASDAEIAAFVGRLRLRTARDTCFRETP